MPVDVLRVDVCVATCRRPEGLRRLLDSLRRQRLPSNLRVRVIVVDNDPAASAHAVVQAACARGDVIDYLRQLQPNLALTRNAAVARASGDMVAFIDDDEWAAEDWLDRLVSSLLAWQADALVGPVQGVLEGRAPAWVRQGRFFDAHRQASRTPVRRGCTGNAIVRADWFRARGLAFDPRFGVTGGEDMALFEALKMLGGCVLWCSEAQVFERVPVARTTLRWLLGRSFRAAQTYADVLGRPHQWYWKLWWLVYRSASALVSGLAALGLWPFRRAWAVRAARRCVSNLGQLSTLGAWRYEEYGRHRVDGGTEKKLPSS